MANPHYSNSTTLVNGEDMDATVVEAKFDVIETSFDSIYDNGTLASLAVDTAVLVVDETNDRVGIGIAAPVQQLHISGGASAPRILMTRTATGDAGTDGTYFSIDANGIFSIVNQEDEAILLATNGAERVRITNDGRVGIGNTPNASAKLDVQGAIYINGSPHASDWVFDQAKSLEGVPDIEKHASDMWEKHHLPWVAPFEVDENGRRAMNVDGRMADILAELELAHIYIDTQQKEIMALQERIEALEKKQ